MNDVLTLRAFFRHYFPAFLGGVFAAYFSIAFAIALSYSTYFNDIPLAEFGFYPLLAGAVVALLLVHSNFMILRGRPKWVRVVNGIFVSCLLFVLPMINYRPNEVVYGLSILAPLLGLLFINSKGQRAMRSHMVEIRHQREAIIRATKASRARH
ncbi:hypothetical protein [Pseudomonas sp. RGM2987]|uniref:hypothetical protein n=1 Tax=Pseudomonas sp. RGM2987 TaxID=2930090 RepID=UPI001FD636A3|nr:hypothetical protein [Pseudomonas sp. RGM2987]MCJ8206222.1 hypothetical protein [Pseudomonas sp. RGM2987]